MKKVTLLSLSCLMLLLMSFTTNREEVQLEGLDDGGNDIRSVVHPPQVWLERTTAQLTISFLAPEQECTTITVTNADGLAIVQAIVVTDGNSHNYHLSPMTPGSYMIHIQSPRREYRGTFTL